MNRMLRNNLLENLNKNQCEAVSAPLGNYLILAGAGSGKTRVLVHRISWLLSVEHVAVNNILTVTFTNKAAAEMRSRIEELAAGNIFGMWNGTFHGLCHKMLRFHHLDAKLPESFQILDTDDQLRLLKRIIKHLNLDDKQWPAKEMAWFISKNKDEGLRPCDIDIKNNPYSKTQVEIYQAYQAACDRAGLVDFAELILRCVELLKNNKTLREHYQNKFSHILVDEFQDTNNIQYQWLRLLAGQQNYVMVVGDDDQSIYGWRGAKVENIQRFVDDYLAVKIIRLEQNYRSTGNILNAANKLIANNTERMGKELWTDGELGELISVYSAFNELDEASFIVDKIATYLQYGGSLNDIAILYRSNAQSRVLEEALLNKSLSYRIYGGLRFFERQEIKDSLAYLRLLVNRNDDTAFERVVNKPTRGIGTRTLEIIRQAARENSYTMWQASLELLNNKVLVGRAANAVRRFTELIEALDTESKDLPMHEQVKLCIENSGLRNMYALEKGEKAQSRLDNLDELITAASQYQIPEDLLELDSLTAFLTHASLEAGEGQAEEYADAVQLMTMHSAKGLEFPVVFMSGVEEGVFPSSLSNQDLQKIQEERRLCYVGMTRAMSKLYITYAETRRLYGQEKYHQASRFIAEIPAEYLEYVKMKTIIKKTSFSNKGSFKRQNSTAGGYTLGQKVKHAKFGIGTIINCEGSGNKARLQIAFNGGGIKWLVAEYARLESC